MANPVLKWPGSKWRLAEWICAHMPPHEVYLEPFAGSLAVLFTKERTRLETVADVDAGLVNFFTVLRERPDELAAAAAQTPWARVEWERSFEPTDDDLEAARRFLVRSHQSHGMRPRRRTGWRHATGASNGTGGIRDVAGQWARLPPLLEAAGRRLVGVQIEQRPALELIARFSHARCCIYADPPYIRATRTDWQYIHELTDDDHSALLSALDAHPGPVLLSGYRCDLYDARLMGWTRLDRKANAEKGRPRLESLWMNRQAARVRLPLDVAVAD